MEKRRGEEKEATVLGKAGNSKVGKALRVT
jgi:hypothetical protein